MNYIYKIIITIIISSIIYANLNKFAPIKSIQSQTPVIGIYTQDAPNFQKLTKTYIAASYVKFI
jgi:hypothetical protein